MPTPGWYPLAHVPAGYVLDRDTSKALHDAWIAKGDDLTDAEIEAIVGAPQDASQILMKRDFLTGEYPAPRQGGTERIDRGSRK